METKQITLTQIIEIGTCLNELPKDKKDLILTHVINLNNAVRDYENRINNAINQLQR